jgi:hypothetical protein
LRRHGAVDQDGVTKAHLNPYLERVRARIGRNPDSPAWSHLGNRWRALVGYAQGILAEQRQGRAGFRHERIAAEEVIKLASAVEPHQVMEAALAMVVMQELDPSRFRSDQAFRTQLVRRIRGLSDLNAGTYYDHGSGKLKRVYRDITPRATAVLGHWLVETFGVAGLQLARLEIAEQSKTASERQEFHQALSELV